MTLQRLHDMLDDQNVDIDKPACLFCDGKGYDFDGLIHEENCVIRIARRELEGERRAGEVRNMVLD